MVNVLYGAAMVAVIGWLITPSEFGAASAALAVIYLIETFTKAGIQDAIITERSAHTEVTDVGHTTAAALSLVGAFIAIILSLPVSKLIGDPQIKNFIWVASLILPGNALVAAPLGILMRKMRTAQLVRRQVISKVVSLIIITSGALAGFGSWAIILSSVAVPMISVINVGLLMTRFPRFRWNYAIARRLITFGLAVSGELACWSIMSRVFALLFGYFHGTAQLGALQFAFRLVDEVANLVRLIVSRLGLSAFAALKRSAGDIATSFDKSTRLLNMASAPMFIGLILMAPTFVEVLFGAKWAKGVPYIQIFAVSWAIAMPRILVSPALRASGKQYMQLAYAAVSACVALVATITFGHITPLLGGIAYASRQVVSVPWGFWTMQKLFGLPAPRQMKALLPAYGAAGMMVAGIEAAKFLLPPLPPLVELISLPILGGVIYVPCVLLFDRTTVNIGLRILKRR